MEDSMGVFSEEGDGDLQTRMLKKLVEDVKKSLDETFDEEPAVTSQPTDTGRGSSFINKEVASSSVMPDQGPESSPVIAEFDLTAIFSTAEQEDTSKQYIPPDTQETQITPEPEDTEKPPHQYRPPEPLQEDTVDLSADTTEATEPPEPEQEPMSSSAAEETVSMPSACTVRNPSPASPKPALRMAAVFAAVLVTLVITGGGLLLYLNQHYPENPSIEFSPAPSITTSQAPVTADVGPQTPLPEPTAPVEPLKQKTEPGLIQSPPADNDTQPMEVLPEQPEQVPAETQPPPSVIHTDSFKTRKLADEEAARLQGFGFPSFVVQFTGTQAGAWYRVLVGPYADRDAAGKVQAMLRSEYNKPDARIITYKDTD